MRKRMIHSSICTSEKLGLVSFEAETLYNRLYTHSDDYGNIPSGAGYAKDKAFPKKENLEHRNNRIGYGQVENWLNELVSVGLLQSYWITGTEYYHFSGFSKHQSLRKDRNRISMVPIHPDDLDPENSDKITEFEHGLPSDNQVTTNGIPSDNQWFTNGIPEAKAEAKAKAEVKEEASSKQQAASRFSEKLARKTAERLVGLLVEVESFKFKKSKVEYIGHLVRAANKNPDEVKNWESRIETLLQKRAEIEDSKRRAEQAEAEKQRNELESRTQREIQNKLLEKFESLKDTDPIKIEAERRISEMTEFMPRQIKIAQVMSELEGS